MDSRLVLEDGILSVLSAPGCVQFVGTGHGAGKRLIAEGSVKGIQYALTRQAEFVDFVFFRKGKSVGRVRIRPQGGEVAMELGTMKNGPEVGPWETVKHFGAFYHLVDLSKAQEPRQKLKAVHVPEDAHEEHERSPGGECPPARFGGS
jgi:hypothetical protein